MTDMYHYTECGLDNVFLINGFYIESTPYGKSVRFDDPEGLDRLIANQVARKVGKLSGKEIRYIRNYMDMSQVVLADFMAKKDAQPIANWEKESTIIPDTENFLLLHIFRQYLGDRSAYVDMVDELNSRERTTNHEIRLEEQGRKWVCAP